MFGTPFCKLAPSVRWGKDLDHFNFLQLTISERAHEKVVNAKEKQMTHDNTKSLLRQQQTEICSEIRALNREKLIKESEQMLLQNNEYDVRQLKHELKRAQMRMAFREQHDELQRRRDAEKAMRKEENLHLRAEQKREDELIKSQEREKWRKKDELRKQLLSQIKTSEMKAIKKKEQTEEDRRQMQKLTEQEHIQMEEEKRQLQKYRKDCQREIEEFLYRKRQHKVDNLEEEIEDRRRYLSTMKARDEVIDEMRKKRNEMIRAREAIKERIGQEVFNIVNQKRKHQDLLSVLQIEERKALEDMKVKQEIESKHQLTRMLFHDMNQVHYVRMQQKKEQLLQEQLLTAEINKDIQRRDAIELEAKRKQRLKNLQYNKDVLHSIQLLSERRDEAIKENLKEYEYINAINRQHAEKAANERLRLLSIQPKAIFKYLPLIVLTEAEQKLIKSMRTQ